ncbi:MAG: DUF6949 family protein [Bauldia sp.]
MFELWLLLYCAAVGFVAAGLASSLFQLVTRRQVAFAVPQPRIVECFVAAVSFAFIGPYIVARGAVRAVRADRRPITWLVGGLAVAGVWSACSGIVVLDFALAMRSSLLA